MYLGRLFLGFLFVLLCIVVLVILFAGHGSKKPTNTSGITVQPLPEYADTDASVSATTSGIVNGDEIHRAIRITVTASSRELDVIQGYSGTVIQTNVFYNTVDAYDVFLRAINYSGFLAKNPKAKVTNDSRGQCPLGFTYNFVLSQDGQELSRSWASTCGTAVGTSSGNSSQLLQLFQNQIPNYNNLTENINLSATAPPSQ